MRTIQTIVACAAALALVGVTTTLQAAENDNLQGKATIKFIQGNVEVQQGGNWTPATVNEELDSGSVVRTGAGSRCDLSVNGLSSAVRLGPDSTLGLTDMSRTSASGDADRATMLDLQQGSIIGNVKKLSANSRYEIKTPHGVAGIRGTDFQVTAVLQPDGHYVVTFTSITGQVIVSASITPGGPIVVKVLRDGESWTPGEGDVHPTPIYILTQLENELATLLQIVYQTLPPIGPPPHVPTFPTGGQPSPT
ncbi:MAG TPA: FecR family protein [Verrucomicrobiae bacterium]|nr:FecR family protein [Verrucomicrobiae bacterium]